MGESRLNQSTPATANVGEKQSEQKFVDLHGDTSALPGNSGRAWRKSNIDDLDHKMSSTARNQTTKTTKLLFYFWLPAGRGEFEFASCDYSPFQNTAKYRDNLEETIAKRLISKLPDSPPGLRLEGIFDYKTPP
jgi:hypothetical protein